MPIAKIISIVVGALAICAGLIFLMLHTPLKTASPTPSPDNPFKETPIPQQSGSVGNPSSQKPAPGISQPDFTKGADVSYDASTTAYYISYPATGTPQYEIDYLSDQSYFVGLYAEPIGDTRKAAITDLENRLQVSDQAMCALSVTVKVPVWISQTYAGTNLGVPGCPGATLLPGD